MMKKKRIVILAASIIAALTSIAIISSGILYYIVTSPQINLEETAYIYIYPHDNSDSVINKIKKAAGPKSTLGFKILAEHNNFDQKKRSGKYAIKDKDSWRTIYSRIISKEQTPVKVVVPSVRSFEQLSKVVSEQLMFDSLSIHELLTSKVFIEHLGYTLETFPTLILPNTYEFYWNIEPEQFISRMMRERKIFWNEERLAKAKAINMTPEEVATLASIVDEETNNNAEKPIVAGLYINRLKRKIPLQADPTVKFAIGDFTRKRILNADLEIESPYNTYKNTGLPPGPIRIATIAGIESVLNHAKHNYIYMCAKEDFSGTHNFATTLAEHNANARRYQAALNKLNIKK
ncbi:MAG: endolytic transglycosylase MltG [Bacteroidales bacterium]|nr:endolytic transglycosylase MltG [Bacteroidales bacterium]